VKWDQKQPCKGCPFRRDTPVGIWDWSHYVELQEQDADELNGSLFACHKYRLLPTAERRPCAGWLLDQRRRHLPSIRLRIALISKPAARALLEEVRDGGCPLYDSVDEMCEANVGQPAPEGAERLVRPRRPAPRRRR